MGAIINMIIQMEFFLGIITKMQTRLFLDKIMLTSDSHNVQKNDFC